MSGFSALRYDPNPTYSPVDGRVRVGWDEAAGSLQSGCRLLAVDGPAALDWPRLIDDLSAALERRRIPTLRYDVREHMLDWTAIVKRTESSALADDPNFATLAGGTLDELFGPIPAPSLSDDRLVIVFGPGAAFLAADALWYADQPKRFAEAAIGAGAAHNLGQSGPDDRGTLRRLFYVDWPLLDRHRDSLVQRIDAWIDLQRPDRPTLLDGTSLRRTLEHLARRPFRTRPTFNTTSWGGHWGQQQFGLNPDAPNTALGYELIAPESGILLGSTHAAVEVPFQLLVATHPGDILGSRANATFGTSFPIRFDYLDTVGGGNLSVHCHPQTDYMREVFGWPYTQHETYYVMVGGPGRQVFLGLREGADLEAFRRQAHRAEEHGEEFDVERFVQTFPATPHQLFLVPAGTPHGSGEGNVVLEISATPYLYSLRVFDWLRTGGDGPPRPIHIDHAFENLDRNRRGAAVAADLVPQPRQLTAGAGWHEDVLGALPAMFFDVRRLEISPASQVESDTEGSFHVLNVVDGDGVTVRAASGDTHRLRYAETLVVPAAVGRYSIIPVADGGARVVKALVR